MARSGRDSAPERERRRAEQERQRQQQLQLDAQRREAQRLQSEQRRAERYAVNTGIGTCPRCGSSNLTRTRRTEANASGQSAACCVGCFLFWPALLLMPFLRSGFTAMHCNACGHEWPA